MDILQSLIQTDKELFLFLNGMHSPFWDNFFWLVTQTSTWVPFYLVVLYAVVRNHHQGWWFTLLALALVVTLCDQISNNVLKEGIERWRPSRDPSLTGLVHLVAGYRGGSFGFVSSHAANSFGLAMFLFLLFRHKGFGIAIFAWALLNSYSRIYLGVHFPGDILGGAILGLLIGWLVYWGYSIFYPRFSGSKNPTKQPGLLGDLVFAGKYMNLLIFSLVLVSVGLLIAAKAFLKMQV
jgi:undecaprenyl-diphosphatase